MKNLHQSSIRTVYVAAGHTTIGLDIGDKFTHFCILDAEGSVTAEGRVQINSRRT